MNTPQINMLVRAGDIAECENTRDEATAAVLDTLPGTVFTAGDNAYDDGTAEEFSNCYAPSWGRHLGRTRPTPGNHDYRTDDGAPYYAYFGAAAGEAGKGFYAYDLGDWHVIGLNSNIDVGADSEQLAWLRADLDSHTTRCAVAYWHHPRFSSGHHGNDADLDAVWQVLYAAGVDVVVNGHDHNYERFAPQTPAAEPDALGIRQFVAGTGGRGLRAIDTVVANSEVRNTDTWGVLVLRLLADAYEWEFVPAAGGMFRDVGRDECH